MRYSIVVIVMARIARVPCLFLGGRAVMGMEDLGGQTDLHYIFKERGCISTSTLPCTGFVGADALAKAHHGTSSIC